MGIIAIPNTVEYLVPDYSVAVELGADTPIVRIDFKKYGHDGILIECRINDGEWTFLDIYTVKPYLDARPYSR